MSGWSEFAGGSFRQAGGQPTNSIPEHRGCLCAADFDGNGVVDTRDVLAFLKTWEIGPGGALRRHGYAWAWRPSS